MIRSIAAVLLFSLLVVGCNSESPGIATPNQQSNVSPEVSLVPQNVMEHGHRANFIFTGDLNFLEIRLFSIDRTAIGATRDKEQVDAIVQAISGATPTTVLDMAFPDDHFKTHIVVELIHLNHKLNVTLHYDQGFVIPQATLSDGMCMLPSGGIDVLDGELRAEADALSDFIQQCKLQDESNAG